MEILAVLYNELDNEIIAITDYCYNFNLRTGLFIYESENTSFGIISQEEVKKCVVLEVDLKYSMEGSFMEDISEGLDIH